jgi:hypothetical protein
LAIHPVARRSIVCGLDRLALGKGELAEEAAKEMITSRRKSTEHVRTKGGSGNFVVGEWTVGEDERANGMRKVGRELGLMAADADKCGEVDVVVENLGVGLV